MTDRAELPATTANLVISSTRLDAEWLLGQHMADAGLTFERQYHYAEPQGRDHRADFAFPPERLLVWVEGGVYGRGAPCRLCGRRPGGAHGSVTGVLADLERSKLAAVAGFRVLRVTPAEVNDGTALRWVLAALRPDAPAEAVRLAAGTRKRRRGAVTRSKARTGEYPSGEARALAPPQNANAGHREIRRKVVG